MCRTVHTALLIAAVVLPSGCASQEPLAPPTRDWRDVLPTLPTYSQSPAEPVVIGIAGPEDAAVDGYHYALWVDPSAGRTWIMRSGGIAGRASWHGPVTAVYWQPTDKELARIRELAEPFIASELGITPEDQAERAVRAHGDFKNGLPTVGLEYFDRKFFPDWEQMHGVFGGFPAYFHITVDVATGQVVDHYASPE